MLDITGLYIIHKIGEERDDGSVQCPLAHHGLFENQQEDQIYHEQRPVIAEIRLLIEYQRVIAET